MYGTQTCGESRKELYRFENDVKMYGTQTIKLPSQTAAMFENDVKMYGTQTPGQQSPSQERLRMM